MKNFIFLIVMTIMIFQSKNLLAQTDFSASYIPSTLELSVSWSDDGLFPPFEGGELWSSIKGEEQRKYVDYDGFSIECEALKNSRQEIYGSCTLLIPIKNLVKVNDTLVYKLKGIKARRMNQFFTDNVYVSTQRNEVYLSAATNRNEFYFGIKEKLIK